MKIVATNVVASRPPERRPTATPTARANTFSIPAGPGEASAITVLSKTKCNNV